MKENLFINYMPHADIHLPESWKYLLHSELTQLNLFICLRAFAFSIISLFVPAYLYWELGYTISEVLMFFVYFALILAFSSPFLVLMSARVGYKHMIIFSVPFQILYLYLLYALPTYNFPLIWIALALGLGIASFNIGVHLEFQSISHSKSRGAEVGSLQAAQIIGLMLGPLLGGGFIHYFSFPSVFILVVVILFCSSFFLFMSSDHHSTHSFSWKKLYKALNIRLALYYLYRGGWIIATGVLWPLYIFLELQSYLTLGVIGTLMALITAFLVFFIGKKSDTLGRHKVVQYSAVPESIGWIFRGFVASMGGIIGMSLFQSLTSSSLQAPLLALEYNQAKKTGSVLEYFVWRQFFVGIGRALLLGIVLWFGSFLAGFAAVGLSTFFVFLL